MKVKAIISGFDLTAGKVYDVKFEYDTVYELKCDTGTYCRNKGFFKVLKTKEELGEELCNYCELDDSEKGVHNYGNGPVMCFDSSCCDRAYERYIEEVDVDEEA